MSLLEKVVRVGQRDMLSLVPACPYPVIIFVTSRDQCQWWPSNRWHVGVRCTPLTRSLVTNSTGHSCWSSLSSLSSLTTRHNYIKHDIPVISDHPRQHSNILRFPLDQIREDVVASSVAAQVWYLLLWEQWLAFLQV